MFNRSYALATGRHRRRCAFFRWVVFAWLLGASVRATGEPAPQISGDDVLQFLDRTVNWYQRVSALNQTAENAQELTLQNALRHALQQALRLSFDFARAEAVILSANETSLTPATGPVSESSSPADRARRLAQMAATATQRIAQLQADVDRLGAEIQKAPADALPLLTARRSELIAELNLAKARGDVLQNLAAFTAGQEAGSAGLLGKIADLERSIPQAASDAGQSGAPAAKDGAKPDTVAETRASHPESVGIVGLVSQMFTLSHQMSELKDLADSTEKLRQANDKLRAPIRAELLDAIHRGDALAASRPTDDAKKLSAQSQELDALAARFRQLAAVGVPLGEQSTMLNASRAALLEWHALLGREYGRTLRSLLFRLSAMGIGIAVVLVLSALWRRATFHYVTDARKRRQFLLVRRIVVGCVMVIMIAAGFVTEIAALATFAGIMTAGIAVALQTLILSGVAYFFFIGRYGVRAGDRVTVGGITGDVVETGLFRLYLMELGGINHLEPTGRVVVFSNSVLFQPAGFFKQLPGANYIWQDLSVTLTGDSDYTLAESKLLEAVNSVFEEYRDQVDTQHAAAREMIHAQLPSPRPQGRLKVVDAGLEFVVRYPVPIHRTAEIEGRITKALLQAIEREPRLHLASAGITVKAEG